MPTLSREEQRARLIVDTLVRLRDMTDEQLAAGQRTRANANQKRRGIRSIGLGDLPWLCEVFSVDPTLFVVAPKDWDEYGRMGLPAAEFDYLRAEVMAHEPVTAEAGAAEVPLVVGVLASALAAWAGARVPAFAMWIAENQRDDEVMSPHPIPNTVRESRRKYCVMNPTLSAINVCTPRAGWGGSPVRCMHTRQGARRAAFGVDPR